MAHVLARQGIPTTLLVRKDSIADEINENHRHPTYVVVLVFCFRVSKNHASPLLSSRYLTELELPKNVLATADAKLGFADATWVKLGADLINMFPLALTVCTKLLPDYCSYIIHAVPVQFTRDYLRKVSEASSTNKFYQYRKRGITRLRTGMKTGAQAYSTRSANFVRVEGLVKYVLEL